MRNVTNALPYDCNFIVCGDFNIYSSDEPAYLKLLDPTNSGYFIDIYNLPGSWNNSAYSLYHTQSTRTRQFGGGSTGGMDDRFDMILMSQSIIDSMGINFLPGSYITYGNDGYHYNDSINKPPNYVVSQQVADALHYSSDHLPVIIKLTFQQDNNYQMVVNLLDGWNLLSVPLLADDMQAALLFPTASSMFYSYFNGYNQVDILENGRGYWAKFDGNQSAMVTGTYASTDEITLFEGWNLVGPFASDVQISSLITVPPDIILTPFYGFENGYNATNILIPGKGYWVKSSASGILKFNRNNNTK